MSSMGQMNYEPDSIQINKYLNDPMLPKIVNDFYLGNFHASDDKQTFILLDTLTSKNDHFFPFYLKIFNGIAKKSDGALSEVMGSYCFDLILNYPKEIFQFFTENKDFISLYSSFLGYEFYFKSKGSSDLIMDYSQFYNYLNHSLNSGNDKMKEALDSFDSQIKEVIKNMNY
jgi:hypothetical protein